MSTTKKNSKGALIVLIIVTLLLIVIVGGYVTVKSTFDPKYEDLIIQYAKKSDLEPAFVAAIVWTESGFDTDAESKAGAQGLMQIMPETADWIAGKLDLDDPDVNDPETNIKMGCWYLSYLWDRFDGEQDTVAAAYNAGHNTVNKWLNDSDYSADGAVLDSIPYAETQNYVKKVSIAYKVYTTLYSF